MGQTEGMRSFFEPKSVAVAGASTDPNKLGSIIFANLFENVRKGLLKARVYALNPAHGWIGSHPCYATIRAIPETPELLIIAVPVSLTPRLVREAAEAGVRAVVIVASGYAEVGRSELETEIMAVAAKHKMRILGPNTIGLLDTYSGVDSLFLRPTKKLPGGSEIVSLLEPLKGSVAIITQSGHLGEIISEQLTANGVGIRALVGTGNQLDVSVEDVIRYFADDARTKVIAVYLEGVRDGRRFMRAAAYAARRKPLLALKVGKTEVGARAALTHTASLVGDYQLYEAAFRQSGVVEARTLQELVDFCVSMSMLPQRAGRRLLIITNAGGVGAIAADEAERSGLRVAPLSESAQARLRSEFRGTSFIANASLANPIDLTATVDTDEFVKATKLALALPTCDMALVLPTHQTPALGFDIISKLPGAVSGSRKPACVCVMGDSDLAVRIHEGFMHRSIPSFPTPERAVRALSALPAYEARRKAARAPAPLAITSQTAHPDLHGFVSYPQAIRLLKSYRIDAPKSKIIRSTEGLGEFRGHFPVACKLLAKGLQHKVDVGGVLLNIAGPSELSSAFSRLTSLAAEKGLTFEGMLAQEMVHGGVEMIVGGTRDRMFGPTILVGLGGTYTELVRDYSLAIGPVTPEGAEAMLEGSRLERVLSGFRGGPKVDLEELYGVVSRFSVVMAENPSIEEMELNPLIATEKELLAVDVRVVASPFHRSRVGRTSSAKK